MTDREEKRLERLRRKQHVLFPGDWRLFADLRPLTVTIEEVLAWRQSGHSA